MRRDGNFAFTLHKKHAHLRIKHVTSHSQYVGPTIRLDSHIASNILGNIRGYRLYVSET